MPNPELSLPLDCPAKINLTLAILGRREDGFHALHSIVAQTRFGDEGDLVFNPEGRPSDDSMTIDGPDPVPEDNTVTTAIAVFREASGFKHGAFHVRLAKHIPIGAGLGGGSSNAVTVLRALRRCVGDDLAELDWSELASRIGSDCPLFLEDQPVLLEGRGEVIHPIDPELAGRLSGLPVILFKPRFAINTADAYRRLAARNLYHDPALAAGVLDAWRASGAVLPPAHNDFQRLVSHWIPSLAIVLERLSGEHGIDARLSGSGSACFAVHEDMDFAVSTIMDEMDRAWGSGSWLVRTFVK